MRTPLTLLLAAVAAIGLTVGTTGAADASAPCATVPVSVSAGGHITVPRHVPSGFVELAIHGAPGQGANLVRPKHGASKADFARDGNLIGAGDVVPYDRDFTSAGGSVTGTDLWLHLSPGTYYLASPNLPGPLTPALVTLLHVDGTAVHATAPHITAPIVAVSDTRWGARPRAIPHEGVMAFANRSSSTQILLVIQLRPGVTNAQLQDVMEHDGDQSTIFEPDGAVYQTGPLSARMTQLSTYSLPRGHYGLFGFWTEPDGTPYTAHGMERVIEIR